ncbi:Mariner Mos1 transposase [Eumeta japonica]|uniref:Mariner Mos1 transposase n=1 Tax=Eumeta variegata TaxID=151549 RepID=A0A4C1XUU5_EUMVA|nr:Mariner Mos1 transposase [Eumeta japonica]
MAATRQLVAILNDIMYKLATRMDVCEHGLLQIDIEKSCVLERKSESLPLIIVTLTSTLDLIIRLIIGEHDIVGATLLSYSVCPSEDEDVLATSRVRPRLIVVQLTDRAVQDGTLQAVCTRRNAITKGTRIPGFYLNELLNNINSLVSRATREVPRRSTDAQLCTVRLYLFRAMAHALSEQRFTSYEDTKRWVDSWIASKHKEFFRLEIQTLPARWKKVVASD